MNRYSTREAAKKLGVEQSTLSKYLKRGNIPSPETVKQGKRISQIWTDAEIEHVRKLLPKIANGRKTRYAKLREKQKAQAKSPVPCKAKKK